MKTDKRQNKKLSPQEIQTQAWQRVIKHFPLVNQDLVVASEAEGTTKPAGKPLRLFPGLDTSRVRVFILMSLQVDQSLRQVDLAERWDVGEKVISRAIKNLVKSGYLNKKSDLIDRRAKTIELTTAGKSFLDTALNTYSNILLKKFNKLK